MFRKAMYVLALLLVGALVWAGGGKEATTGGGTASAAAKALAATWPEFNTYHEAQVVCFEQGWTGPEADRDFITPEIANRTNFKMKYEPMTVATEDDYNQKLNLMVASREVPQIFFGGAGAYTRDMYDKMGKAGMIWDVAPYINAYKNIGTLVKPELTQFRASDGKANYFIPTQTGRGNDLVHNAPNGLYLRDDLLKKLNLAYPTTPEEFYTYLKRATELPAVDGKTMIGYTSDEGLGNLQDVFIYPFFPVGQIQNDPRMPWDRANNFKIINYMFTDSPELMRAAKFMSKAYREGLIDRELVSHKRAQFQEKASSGRAAAIGSPWWDMNTFSDNAKAVVPDLMYVASKPIFDKANGVPNNPNEKWTNWLGSWSSLIISKKLDEATMKHFLAMLDYLTTKDGQILVQVGIEGKNFQYNAQGKYYFTDEFKKLTGDLDWNKAASYGVYYYQQFVMNLPIFDDLRAEYPELVRADNYKGWENKKWFRDNYVMNMDPPKDYYFVAGPVEVQKLPAIESAKQEMFVKVLLAKNDAEVESVIHAWGKTCKDMGIDEIIAERQKITDAIKL